MIMLIDDDQDDCDIFCDAAMQVADCKCHCVNNAVDALSILERTDKLPSCIFLDINMPVMNGFAALARIRSNPKLSKIPVIVYSTTQNPSEAKECLELGAKKFIRKTANYRSLVNTLREVKSELIDPR